jgi:hypothetical protein
MIEVETQVFGGQLFPIVCVNKRRGPYQINLDLIRRSQFLEVAEIRSATDILDLEC